MQGGWNKLTAALHTAVYVGLAVASVNNVRAGDAFGTYLGSVNTVGVYSNGYSGYWSGVYNYVNRTSNGKTTTFKTGAKWQCVELPSRYYWQLSGKQYTAVDAYKWFSAGYSGLRAVKTGSAELPPAGAILCWSGGSGGLGHVAVVTKTPKSTDTLIYCANQNVNCTSDDVNRWVKLTVTKNSAGAITGVKLADDGPSRGSTLYKYQGFLAP